VIEATAGTVTGHTTPAPHRYTPEPLEPGRRPLCRVCGREKHPSPIPTPRSSDE
jgi:hypothetical protein